jgi:hypothetical protein
MTHTFQFRFNELSISRAQIITTLGYQEADFPEPFPSYLDEVYDFAKSLEDIRATFLLVDEVELRTTTGELMLNKVAFKPGEILLKELRNSTRAAIFICTAGEHISNKSKALMMGEDPILGFVYDVMGTFIAESAGQKLREIMGPELEARGEKMTNLYSPGHTEWSVTEQHQLFDFFGGQTCGVKLTSSALMNPVKSISGVIGIGPEVIFRKNRCAVCTSKSCMYRNKNKGSHLPCNP